MKPISRRVLKGTAAAVLTGVLLTAAAIPAFFVFDHYNPPPLDRAGDVSVEVVDADGKLLRAFATSQDRWRLRTSLNDVDQEFQKLLIAYEDQRFWTHPGVDAKAILRAFGQMVANRRIVSGASTITMQLARLLEPREHRSFKSKLLQMVRALQIERRLTKEQILERYLMLAPYGGNLEGVRAASLAYFDKEPKGLTLGQSALLVALPQSPERRRPDRFPDTARTARNTVLARAAAARVIAPGEVERAAATSVSSTRFALPHHAAHLAERMVRSDRGTTQHRVTLKRHLQRSLEDVARDAVRRFGDKVSVALVLADAHTGRILAEVGSPDYLSVERAGWVDMTNAVRSPGSALKPFIYGLAFEEGVVRPETLIVDRPANFSGYRPQNFDLQYQGEISVRKALQLSLNVPAVHLLEAVGPARLMAKFRKAGVSTVLPRSGRPGLAIGLGGVGVSLKGLTQLYTALANAGRATSLHNRPSDGRSGYETEDTVLLQPDAAWHVTDILSGTPPPTGAGRAGIAYKTGTSYGYRDAWSFGYDGRHVIGIWVGRADNGPVPGLTGRSAAAPILFEAFARTGLAPVPFAPAPPGALRTAHGELPITLQRFTPDGMAFTNTQTPEPAPQIIYPPAGARVVLGATATGQPLPLVMKLQDGRPPFRWLANGKIVAPSSRRRTTTWTPDGAGYSTLTVIDSGGRAASVNVFLQSEE